VEAYRRASASVICSSSRREDAAISSTAASNAGSWPFVGFENPLTFPSVEPFVEYTRASLSEDRKLWGSFFQTKDDFGRIMDQIKQVAQRRLEKDGTLVMTKVVGGILATK
jgi:hypothetical protein